MKVERWIEDGQGGYSKAVQIAQEGDWLILQTQQGEACPAYTVLMTSKEISSQTRRLHPEDTWPINPPKFDRADDIADLTFLNEPSVIFNLAERFSHDKIYTRSGPFLIAINPYKDVEGLFTSQSATAYRSKHQKDKNPHIFDVARAAWEAVIANRRPQTILVTGESGAGKTVNTAMCLRYLTLAASARDSAEQATSRLEDQILQANPLLEAFGNAQTVRNNNSSRFGKYIKIAVSTNGAVQSANIKTYILEKSRVVSRHVNERSFHVFYQVLAGASESLLARIRLDTRVPTSYRLLAESATSIPNVDDTSAFAATVQALQATGFSEDEQQAIFSAVSLVLNLGDLVVEGTLQPLMRASSALTSAACLLGISEPKLVRLLLTPQIQAGAARELVTQSRTKAQVSSEIAALARAVYERTFTWLVNQLNARILAGTQNGLESCHTIGLLDVAGFEVYSESNSLEQLMINSSNERLQQLFNSYFFEQEQNLYVEEGLPWVGVDYGKNLQPTIDVIEGTRPLGILAALDDESIVPSGSDIGFTRKVTDSLAGTAQSVFMAHRAEGQGFTIRHYAGPVSYSTAGWLSKNKDSLNTDLLAALANSTAPFVASLFQDAQQNGAQLQKNSRKAVHRTLGQHHKEDLTLLMQELGRAEPHFVRCIVPNSYKTPGVLQTSLVVDQLRCNGVLEGLRLARHGFPNRLGFTEFINRYGVMDCRGCLLGLEHDVRTSCQRLVDDLQLLPEAYGIGRTRIFFKAGILAQIEEQRDILVHQIFGRFQGACRTYLVRYQLHRRKRRSAAITLIQRNVRAYHILHQWPWWKLYVRLLPLLTTPAVSNAGHQRELERLLATERSQWESRETAQRMELERERHAARQRLEDCTTAHDTALREQEEQAHRLADEVAAMQVQLINLKRERDEARQLEADACAARDTALAASESARNEVKSITRHLQDSQMLLEAAEEQMTRTDTQLQSLEEARSAEIRKLEESGCKIAELEHKLAQRDVDLIRHRERFDRLTAEIDAKDTDHASQLSVEKLRLQEHQQRFDNMLQRINILEASRTDSEQSLAHRDAEIYKCNEHIATLENDKLRLMRELVSHVRSIEAAQSEATLARSAEKQAAVDSDRVRRDLDGLRSQLEAKTNAESGQAELIRSLRQENEHLAADMAAMREAERGQASEIAQLRQQNDSTGRECRRLEEGLQSSDTALAVQRASCEAMQATCKEACSNRAAAEASLSVVQSRLQHTVVAQQELQRKYDAAQQESKYQQQRHQKLEDALIEIDHERAILDLQSQQLADALRNALSETTALQKLHKAAQKDAESSAEKCRHAERQKAHLAKMLDESRASLEESRALQNHKIVEHVHVLEKAKKLTDQELRDTLNRLHESQLREKKLELAKDRLRAELHDLSHWQTQAAAPPRGATQQQTDHKPARDGISTGEKWRSGPNGLASAIQPAETSAVSLDYHDDTGNFVDERKTLQAHVRQAQNALDVATALRRRYETERDKVQAGHSAFMADSTVDARSSTQDFSGENQISPPTVDLSNIKDPHKSIHDSEEKGRHVMRQQLMAEKRASSDAGERFSRIQMSYQEQLEQASAELDFAPMRSARFQDEIARHREVLVQARAGSDAELRSTDHRESADHEPRPKMRDL